MVKVEVNVSDTISAESVSVSAHGIINTNTLSAKSVNTYGEHGHPSITTEYFTGEFDTVDICGNFSCTDMSSLTANELEIGYYIHDDRIYIGSLGSGINQISIKNGQVLTDEENIYSGNVSASDIECKTLRAAKSTITYEENEHGTVSGVSEAMSGDEVTVTVTPNYGYQLYSLVYEEVNGNQVDIKDNKFKMPSGNITVKAIFLDNNLEEYLTEHINKVRIEPDISDWRNYPDRIDKWNSAKLYFYNAKTASDYYNTKGYIGESETGLEKAFASENGIIYEN